jgi:hypothetical protein
MAATMTWSHELNLAQAAGLPDDRAIDIRDAVFADIGDERFVQVLIECHYQIGPADDLAPAFDCALEASGYNAARRRLFGDSN